MSDKKIKATQALISLLLSEYKDITAVHQPDLINKLQDGKMLTKPEARHIEAVIAETVRKVGLHAVRQSNHTVCSNLHELATLSDAYMYYARPGTYSI